MDKETAQAIKAKRDEYKAEQQRLEQTLFRLQGAIIALEELLKADEPAEVSIG